MTSEELSEIEKQANQEAGLDSNGELIGTEVKGKKTLGINELLNSSQEIKVKKVSMDLNPFDEAFDSE